MVFQYRNKYKWDNIIIITIIIITVMVIEVRAGNNSWLYSSNNHRLGIVNINGPLQPTRNENKTETVSTGGKMISESTVVLSM